MTNVQLLTAYLESAAKSKREFRGANGQPNVKAIARDKLLRDHGTVFRWLRREVPIPQVVVQHMAKAVKPRGRITRVRLASTTGTTTTRARRGRTAGPFLGTLGNSAQPRSTTRRRRTKRNTASRAARTPTRARRRARNAT